ncbi:MULTISPECIES: hypothetical protein, partial [Lactobacillus]|uniref:hypothetical protein n=1 Tax=Lactobacillus TaxID=1578 RepID=UPI001AEFF959
LSFLFCGDSIISRKTIKVQKKNDDLHFGFHRSFFSLGISFFPGTFCTLFKFEVPSLDLEVPSSQPKALNL